MTLLVHGQVASGFAQLVKLLVEGLVATVEQIDLGPVKGRIIVLVVITVLVTQIPRADGISETKHKQKFSSSRVREVLDKASRALTELGLSPKRIHSEK